MRPLQGLALGLAIGAGWALACPAAAQDPAGRPLPPSIRVMGQATVSARPDQAQINIGVVTQAPAAQEASAQNARQTDAVLAELRRTLGAGADIRTASYAISPNYRYPREGGQPTITGYTATNVVQVKTDRLADVGKVIDVATASGANTIQGLQFTLKDEAAARLKALGDAAVKARTQAQALATALGLKIVRVLSVVEGEPTVVHPMRVEALAARAGPAAPTPVEPGTIDIRATVTLTVEVSP